MDLGLKGKTVLITGGSKGIGLACAMAFAAEGCDLHLAARNRELLETVRRTIRAAHSGVDVSLHAVDLRDGTALHDLALRAETARSWSTTRATSPAAPSSRWTRASGGKIGRASCRERV